MSILLLNYYVFVNFFANLWKSGNVSDAELNKHTRKHIPDNIFLNFVCKLQNICDRRAKVRVKAV